VYHDRFVSVCDQQPELASKDTVSAVLEVESWMRGQADRPLKGEISAAIIGRQPLRGER
jgi:hypothetical protein